MNLTPILCSTSIINIYAIALKLPMDVDFKHSDSERKVMSEPKVETPRTWSCFSIMLTGL